MVIYLKDLTRCCHNKRFREFLFGILRDPDTLEWLGPAPIFDSGSSLGYDLEPEDIVDHAGESCKPFAEYFGIQMQYVTDMSWVDIDELRSGIADAGELLGSVNRYRAKGRDRAVVELLTFRVDDVRRVSSRDHS